MSAPVDMSGLIAFGAGAPHSVAVPLSSNTHPDAVARALLQLHSGGVVEPRDASTFLHRKEQFGSRGSEVIRQLFLITFVLQVLTLHYPLLSFDNL